MPFGFDSVYGNGGQNAIYTARFGGGGGAGGAGGGGNLNAQMQAMSSFDPADYLNVAQQNAWQRDEDLFRRGQTVKKQDRAYAKKEASSARNRASREQVWNERQAQEARRKAAQAANGPDGWDVSRQRAPMRWTNVMGARPFLTPDINRMTGAQRQMFLPQSAGFSGGSPSRMELSGAASDAATQDLFDARIAGLVSPAQRISNLTLGRR